LTLNLENHESTCGFHSGYLQTWLHWNNKISIDDLKTDAIVLVASISVKLKLHSLNKIIFFKKIIKHVVKAKKNLHWKVVVPLSLVLTGKWISIWRDPPDVVRSHSTTPRHESMSVPQVPVLGRNLMTCDHQYCC
jgi:hypothetical protein